MGKKISIEPMFNVDAIQAYGDRHGCRDPQTHIAARLEVLSELSDLVDEDGGAPISPAQLVGEIKKRHQAATQEFLGFFGGAAAEPESSPEFRSGPSDEVLIALAKVDYGSDDIEIDSNAAVSRGDDPGAFVAAWVWVAFPDES